MDRPVPPLTRNPHNPRTTLDFSTLLRTRTAFRAARGGERVSGLLAQRASAPDASSTRTFRTATTASRVRKPAAPAARHSNGVVNP